MANEAFNSFKNKRSGLLAYPETAIHRWSSQPGRLSLLIPQLEDLDFGGGLDLFPERFENRYT